MKNVFKKSKYSWHLLNYTYSRMIIQDCLDQDLRSKIEKKMKYHEKSVMSHLI